MQVVGGSAQGAWAELRQPPLALLPKVITVLLGGFPPELSLCFHTSAVGDGDE